jgi:hypothetical protein
MGKISKKYIGEDQVGSVQLELENALSLRAKSQDGLSSYDLLELDANNNLIVQQTLNIEDEKNLYSLTDIDSVFNIVTVNSADLNLKSNDLASGTTGNLNLISGNATSGDSGNIALTTGTASGIRGSISSSCRFFNVNVPDAGELAIYSDFGAGTKMKFRFTDYGQASDAAGLAIEDCGSVLSFIISSISQEDQAAAPTVLNGTFSKSAIGGVLTGGDVNIYSGVAQSWSVSAANAEASSGSIEIKSMDAYIKGTGANASSGNISITTGTKQGTGTRGYITLNALKVECSEMQFKDAADPTDAQDLATKAYVDAAAAGSTTYEKEEIELTSGMISAQEVELSEQYVPFSLVVGVGQRVNLYEGLDFDVVVVDGVSVIQFTGPSATGGTEALVEDDVLYIQGLIDSSP